jgi:subtilisin family serine protease
VRLDEPRRVFTAGRHTVPGPIELEPRAVEIDPRLGPIAGGVEIVGAPRVWTELGVSGEGVVVAVLDSGLCWDHPGIAGRVWVNPGEDLDGDGVVMDPDDLDGVDDDGNGLVDDLIGWDFADGDGDPMDESGHGSHVAGTVAGDGSGGVRAGVAPGVRVMALRVGTRSSQEASVWRGIEYAVAEGADVVNMSLGWRRTWHPDAATWRRVAEAARAAGVVLFAAAGNEGGTTPPIDVRTPADVPGVAAVGATDGEDAVADFSSRGPVSWEDVPGFGDFPYPPGLRKPDFAAPGVEVLSHLLCFGYWPISGTSMASPHAAGVAALVLEALPGAAPDTVLGILSRTALDVGASGPDNDSGAGRVDAWRAVKEARERAHAAASNDGGAEKVEDRPVAQGT